MIDMSEQRFFESPQEIIIPEETPLVFLEGPVQGSPNWQTPLAQRLLDRVPNLAVASPRALKEHEEGFHSDDESIKALTSEHQVAYEFIARQRAFRFGVVAMWWSAQDPTLPYKEGRVYGKTSAVETGEPWGWIAALGTHNFVVGYDPEYKAGPANSKDYILKNQYFLNIPTQNSLEEFEEAIVDTVANVDRLQVPASTSQSVQRALDRLHSTQPRTY
jgi:hypothetical protein